MCVCARRGRAHDKNLHDLAGWRCRAAQEFRAEQRLCPATMARISVPRQGLATACARLDSPAFPCYIMDPYREQ